VAIVLEGEPWPLFLRRHTNADLETFPVAAPDLAALEAMMWELDAPFRKRVTERGNVELEASGLAAVCLSEWVQGLFLPS
jgi:hypothetical protein